MPVSAYYVYILSNFARTVLYVGVTNNLERRIAQHKSGEGGVFTSTYKCHYLMHYETYSLIIDAISREKSLKRWKRQWKIHLIQKENPAMSDLAEKWFS